MLHLFTCHGRIMPRLVELLLVFCRTAAWVKLFTQSRRFDVQVSPITTRWSGCTNPDRVIGEARNSFGADWSDIINVEMHETHVYTSHIFKGVLRNGQKKKCLFVRTS